MTPNKFYFYESHPHPIAVETTSMIYAANRVARYFRVFKGKRYPGYHWFLLALFPRFSGKRYPGYQRFLLACDEELRRPQVKQKRKRLPSLSSVKNAKTEITPILQAANLAKVQH